MTEAPILTLDRVAAGYGRFAVVSDINVTLNLGSFTGLVGPNGSGKSTLLKTILGIHPPVAGSVKLHPIDGRPPVCGYVPQRESLDPIYLLSSFEVALMGVCGRTGPGRRISKMERSFVEDCLAQTGAADFAGKLFSLLSGGQKQRVLLARALATRPDVLVLDEPISGIDASASRAIMELLRELHQRQHQTILMVSHDLGTIRQYAGQALWLHRGTMLCGPVTQLLSREKIEELLELNLN